AIFLLPPDLKQGHPGLTRSRYSPATSARATSRPRRRRLRFGTPRPSEAAVAGEGRRRAALSCDRCPSTSRLPEHAENRRNRGDSVRTVPPKSLLASGFPGGGGKRFV